MSTAAQLKANRKNSQRSTGPVTQEGKSASSLNHLKHGFCGAFRILKHESAEAYDALLAALREEHQPTTPTENILVERIARHQWLSQRAQFLQSSLFFDRHLTAAEQNYLALYLRYQSTNDRAFFNCLNQLAKLRADRRKQEIGFERETRSAAEEIRHQESHNLRTRIANARARHLEIDLILKESSIESLLAPGLGGAARKTPLPVLIKISNAA